MSNLTRRALLQYALTVAGGSAIVSGGATARSPTPDPPDRDHPMFSVDAANTGHNPYTTGPTEGVTEQWVKEVGEAGAPVVHDGTVYCGRKAFNASDGTEQWTANVPDGNSVGTPAVASGRVYLPVDESVYALDVASGEPQWQYQTDGTIWSPVTYANGTVYVGSNDSHVYAIDAGTGGLEWLFDTESPNRWDYVSAAPAVVGGTVYVGGRDAAVHAFDAESGQRKWETKVGHDISDGPAVADGTVYASSADNHLYALNAEDGSRRWRFQMDDDATTSPAVTSDTVFAGSASGMLYALSVSDGSEQWRFSVGGGAISSPTVVNDTVYFEGGTNTVHALRAEDGQQRWEFTTESDISSSPAVVDNRVYVEGRDLRALWTGPAARIDVSTRTPFRFQSTTLSASSSKTFRDDPISTYKWAFGEDSVFTHEGEELTRRFEATGTQTVRLRVTDTEGRTDTASYVLDVQAGPAIGAAGVFGVGGYLTYRQFSGGDTEGQESPENDTPESDDSEPGQPTAEEGDNRASEEYVPPENIDGEESETSQTDQGDSGDTSEMEGGIELPPAAVSFLKECEAAQSVREATVEGPLHTFSGTLVSGADVTFRVVPSSVESNGLETAFVDTVESWRSVDGADQVATVHEYGTEPRPWVAYESPSGTPLAKHSNEAVELRVQAVASACEAIRDAGRYNVRHHDLTPKSLYVAEDGTVTLVGWGIDRVLREHSGGPPTRYDAPEEADSGTVGPSTDVYQLGALAYFAVTGKPPFADVAPDELATAIQERTPTPPSEFDESRAAFDTRIQKAMAKAPEERYTSPLHLRRGLLAAL